ncbi:tryptophan synthase subunit alpha [Peribacillus alkalitolerans]|uniref:tryptophan synthase subunit alpha n=1 Tax=Peribacillus alkalitolerans TaxID=1550385 RepID=UPI0013CF9AB8|nr:tryptophan synthase subunit alpha [Peribacillus alkalitolerans]
MTNQIQLAIEHSVNKGEKAFVPYIMAGDGGLDRLVERLEFLEQAGATVIEIGIPFSDPVADGPTIQAAGQRALKAGTTLKGIFETLEHVRRTVTIPLIFMTYLNPILSYGIDQFAKACKTIGLNGVIIPDLPLEEEGELKHVLKEADISLIRLATLTSPLERLKTITQDAEGFIYAVTVKGVTGARGGFEEEVTKFLGRLKLISPIPVLAGFGISNTEQVKEITQFCDGVVVGSQIIQHFENGEQEKIKQLLSGRLLVNIK